MPESGGPGWAEFTPRELVTMTADGHLRSWSEFHATHPVPVIEAALRGFPIPPLLLWRAPEGVLWVLDGANTVAAFQRALGVGSGPDLVINAARGEVLERPRDPDLDMIVLPLVDILSTEDIDELLQAELLTGSYAQHVRAVMSIHSYRILAVVTDVAPSELPAAAVLHGGRSVLLAVDETLKARSPQDAVPEPRSPATYVRPDLTPVAVAHHAVGYPAPPSIGWAALLAAVGITDGPPVDAAEDLSEPLREELAEAVWAVRRAVTFAERTFRTSGLDLIPQPGALGVLARLELLNQPGPLGSTGLMLLRRWLWRRALLTADELGGTGVRPDELELSAPSPEAAARALLGTVPGGTPPTPQLHTVGLSSTWSRLHLLGMLSLRPRDLRTSLPVPDTELTPTSGRIGRRLVPSAAADRLDNLLFHPRLSGPDGTRRVLQDVDDDAVLAS
ncbi:MAG: hypothetical protein M3R63_03665, partial [Actinomycetota bacterium]|nr:hypothetical protein [Actinomycetota bacterium]